MPKILLSVALIVFLFMSANAAAGAPFYKLAYESTVDGQTDIYITDLSGSNPMLSVEDAVHPTLTSGGLLFLSAFEETVWGDFWKSYYQLPAGLKEVTTNIVFTEHEPSVSRNGGQVAYSSPRSGTGEIIFLPLSYDEAAVRITQNELEDLEPALDGKGEYVYWTAMDKYQVESMIWRARTDGSKKERISPPTFRERHPSVDASNSTLAFSSERDGNSEIYVMNLATRQARRLTENEAWDGHPCISSDGKWVVFASDRDGNREIYVIGSDGAGLRRITDNTAEDDNPAIS